MHCHGATDLDSLAITSITTIVLDCPVAGQTVVVRVDRFFLATGATLRLPDAPDQEAMTAGCGGPAIFGLPGPAGLRLQVWAREIIALGTIDLSAGGAGQSVRAQGCNDRDIQAQGGDGGQTFDIEFIGESVTDAATRTGGFGGSGGDAFAIQGAPPDNESNGSNGTILAPDGGNGTVVLYTARGNQADGADGRNATARGGSGAAGPTRAGHGGNAVAVAGAGLNGSIVGGSVGRGGNGGRALASGGGAGTGPLGAHAGNATALGGRGGDAANVTIELSGNVSAGSGGRGGDAQAFGGDANVSAIQGGHGGNAFAFSGFGGRGGSDRTLQSRPGDGGFPGSALAVGGSGGTCPTCNGGAGGNATAYSGKGGDGGGGVSRPGLGAPMQAVIATGGEGGFGFNGGPGGSAIGVQGNAGNAGPRLEPFPSAVLSATNSTTASKKESPSVGPMIAGVVLLVLAARRRRL